MHKIIFHLLLLAISISSFSQENKKISIHYKTISLINLDELSRDVKSDAMKMKYAQKIKESFEKMEYILKIDSNTNSSLFETVRKMETENSIYDSFKTTKSQKFYVDSKEYIEQVDGLGEKFLITEPAKNIKWNLTKETKKVFGYLCYKATFEIERKGIKNMKIEAWYAPKLSYQFGPKGYHGLPGLILEIKQNDKLVITTKKINFNDNFIIAKPKKGKKLSQLEMNGILFKAINELKGN